MIKIKNEGQMEEYRANLELWKIEQKRQFEEFIIEENELEARLVSFLFVFFFLSLESILIDVFL